jgi:hypothetical protein
MAAQRDCLKDKPEIKEGYDNEYMRMFVKQFASYFLEVYNSQPGKPNELSKKREMGAPAPESQR